MEAEQLTELQRILEHAAQLSEVERARYLQDACGIDTTLRREADALLPHYLAVAEFEPKRPPSVVLRVPGTTTAAGAFGDATRTQTRTHSAGQPLPLGPEWAPPFKLGAFTCDRLIGRGGMGAVFRAFGGGVQDAVALKVMPLAKLTDERIRQFSLEAELLRKLRHPFLAQTYLVDAAELQRPDLIPTPTDPLPFLVMEFIDGLSLIDHARLRRLSLQERLDLFLAVCIAMSHAHHRGVTHCDLKPSNVLVRPDGTPRLLDFGVARLMGDAPGSAGEVFCTPAYAAPEQVLRQADAIGPATDVFSLGIIALELITGVLPERNLKGEVRGKVEALCEASFADGAPLAHVAEPASTDAADSATAAAPEELARKRIIPTPLKDPDPLLQVLCRALAAAPADRFPSAAELTHALEPVLRADARPSFWKRVWTFLTGEGLDDDPADNRPLQAVLRQRLDLAVDAETYRLARKRRRDSQ